MYNKTKKALCAEGESMTYDLVIIGAGPAGATLARELAAGSPTLRIALIDGAAAGVPKVCGGLLSEDAQALMAKMGLTLPREVLADPQIFAVETIDLGRSLARTYVRNYINMDRLAFDRWLISLIPESVEIIEGRCAEISRTGGGFRLSLRTSGGMLELHSERVVGAEGASSLTRRTLFDKGIYKYVSIQQWFENSDTSLPPYSCIYDRATSDSCSWTVRKGKYFIFGGAFAAQGCRAAFEAQRKRLEEYLGRSLGTPAITEACQVCSPRRGSDFLTGSDGAYLIGEAAGFISASSFEGISSAMLSAHLLSEAILAGGNDERRVARLYRKLTRPLRRKLKLKIPKMRILSSPSLRYLIMKSGVTSIEKYQYVNKS